ncbi:hypothetical protein Ndes2437B_g07055 [Nannochloris sp. 'desiccata']
MPDEIMRELKAYPRGVVNTSHYTMQATESPTLRGSDGNAAIGEAASPARAPGLTTRGTADRGPSQPLSADAGQKRPRQQRKNYVTKEQAKKHETQHKLKKLSEDIALFRFENAQLAFTGDILQKALAVRDDQLKILQYSKELDSSPPPSSISITASAFYASPIPATCTAGTTCNCTTTRDPTHMASCMAAAAFASDPSKPKSTPKNNFQHYKTPEQQDPPQCPITNLTRLEIPAAIQGANFKAKYTTLCNLLGNALSDRDFREKQQRINDKSEESMVAILNELGVLCFDKRMLKPTAIQKLLITGVADIKIVNKVEKWAAIQADLGMSNEQRNQMQPARDAFLFRVGEITKARSALLESLKESLVKQRPLSSYQNPLHFNAWNDIEATAAAGGGIAPSLPSFPKLEAMHTATAYWIFIHEKTQALEANLMEEHLACMELVAKCFGGVLTPLQKAKAIVDSYPAFPDVLAIATAAAVELQRQKNSTGNLSGICTGIATCIDGDKTTKIPNTTIGNVNEISLLTTEAVNDNHNTIQTGSSS